ncbi:zinc ribbon-containing protein [Marinobacterium aestuariivivens]|uniref:Zinc ribbon-containing protein n=1 Tax=Marinobacterium aestuariivivens TaxID=1698799 RepID=A0ABW1ZY03_9GAMM
MSEAPRKPENEQDPSTTAYDRILKRLLDDLEDAEIRSWDYLQERIEEAARLELTAEEMTRDEMDLLTAYLKRDLKKLGYYAHETGEGIAAWLHFDLNILETRLVNLLKGLADRTRIDQETLRERLDHGEDDYLAGEIATAGTLACLNCGATQELTETSRIEPCSTCGKGYFRRISRPWPES